MNTNIIYILIIAMLCYMLYFRTLNSILISNAIILLLLMTIIYNNNIEFLTLPADIDTDAISKIADIYNTDPLTLNTLTVTNTANIQNLNSANTITAQNLSVATIQPSNTSSPILLQGNVNVSGNEIVQNLTANLINASNVQSNTLSSTQPATINGAIYGANNIVSASGATLKLNSTAPAYYPTTGPGAKNWWEISANPTPLNLPPPS